MTDKYPLSIGLPVFNGEKYLAQALDSILAQTYRDFELIISDNASSDSTEKICQEYAAMDNRIHYYRNRKNIGAPKNFNRTFELSSGKYFKWAAYDDTIAPEYLQKCVAVLDKDPSVVLCHSITGRINEKGALIGIYNQGKLKKIGSNKPHERFGELIGLFHFCTPGMGVIRSTELSRTPLQGCYIGSDRNLLAELGLIGRIQEIPECLAFQRDHPNSYSSTRPWPYTSSTPIDSLQKEMAWWSKDEWTFYPHWKNCNEYFKSVNRVHLPLYEKALCYDQIFRWITKEGWQFMGIDIEISLLRNSNLARKLIPFVFSNLIRAKILYKKMI